MREAAVDGRRAGRAAETAPDGLDRLIETERQLEARLAAVAAEAERIRTEARARVAAIAGADGAAANAAAALLEERIARERDVAMDRIAEDSHRICARYEDLSPARIDLLAALVLERLFPPSDAQP